MLTNQGRDIGAVLSAVAIADLQEASAALWLEVHSHPAGSRCDCPVIEALARLHELGYKITHKGRMTDMGIGKPKGGGKHRAPKKGGKHAAKAKKGMPSDTATGGKKPAKGKKPPKPPRGSTSGGATGAAAGHDRLG